MSHATPKKEIPVIEMTRGEFAAIPKVKSQAEVESLAKRGFKRVAAEGDGGNWFVCYPADNYVLRVKFIVRSNSAASAVKSSETIEQVVSRRNASRACPQ